MHFIQHNSTLRQIELTHMMDHEEPIVILLCTPTRQDHNTNALKSLILAKVVILLRLTCTHKIINHWV